MTGGTACIQATFSSNGTVSLAGGPWPAPSDPNWILPNSKVSAQVGSSLKLALKGVVNTADDNCQIGLDGPSLTITVQ